MHVSKTVPLSENAADKCVYATAILYSALISAPCIIGCKIGRRNRKRADTLLRNFKFQTTSPRDWAEQDGCISNTIGTENISALVFGTLHR